MEVLMSYFCKIQTIQSLHALLGLTTTCPKQLYINRTAGAPCFGVSMHGQVYLFPHLFICHSTIIFGYKMSISNYIPRSPGYPWNMDAQTWHMLRRPAILPLDEGKSCTPWKVSPLTCLDTKQGIQNGWHILVVELAFLLLLTILEQF